MVLHVRGTIPKNGVAVIGSRTPPPEAGAFAYELAKRLGEPIVAGLAPGIDAAAHRGALAAGVPTVAFVGYGFGATDPPGHAELEAAIVAAGGALATLMPARTPASPQSRIERDRLQAKYSRAMVLVCSEIGGGAMYAMRFAEELGRPRYALEPPNDDAVWAGNRFCLRSGAIALSLDVEAACLALQVGRDRDIE
ncbi:MAG TPA: DNA-processing protein DprA [Candidatus Cybelea sp.]|jgi:DNA processing protein|nr:DNA-processing protein DprA [Candidatus Cybelea sp.]